MPDLQSLHFAKELALLEGHEQDREEGLAEFGWLHARMHAEKRQHLKVHAHDRWIHQDHRKQVVGDELQEEQQRRREAYRDASDSRALRNDCDSKIKISKNEAVK